MCKGVPPGTRSRSWHFCRNNPDPVCVGDTDPLPVWSGLKYRVFQYERGESGTPHFQGGIFFKTARTIESMIKKIPGAHFCVARGDEFDNTRYCTKSAGYIAGPWVVGDPLKSKADQGNDERDRWHKIRDLALAGDWDSLLRYFPREYVFQKRHLVALHEEGQQKQALLDLKEDLKEAMPQLHPWQQDILEMLQDPPKRMVHWRWCADGNSGKSTFADYLEVHHNAFVITGGALQDMIYMYKREPIVVFDIARSETVLDHIYCAIEKFVNGRFNSTKYESERRRFRKPVIIVFANHPPDTCKCSHDRWDIIEI